MLRYDHLSVNLWQTLGGPATQNCLVRYNVHFPQTEYVVFFLLLKGQCNKILLVLRFFFIYNFSIVSDTEIVFFVSFLVHLSTA
jgi:hypothetical protein